MVKKTEKKKRK